MVPHYFWWSLLVIVTASCWISQAAAAVHTLQAFASKQDADRFCNQNPGTSIEVVYPFGERDGYKPCDKVNPRILGSLDGGGAKPREKCDPKTYGNKRTQLTFLWYSCGPNGKVMLNTCKPAKSKKEAPTDCKPIPGY